MDERDPCEHRQWAKSFVFCLEAFACLSQIFSEYPMLSICTLRGFKSTASECLCLCKCMCICIGKNYSIYIWKQFSWSLFIWLRWWNAWKQSFYTMLNMFPLHTLDPMRIFCALFTFLFVTLATIFFSPLGRLHMENIAAYWMSFFIFQKIRSDFEVEISIENSNMDAKFEFSIEISTSK